MNGGRVNLQLKTGLSRHPVFDNPLSDRGPTPLVASRYGTAPVIEWHSNLRRRAMDEFLTDREVALIITVVRLLGKQPNPTMVQEEYQRAKAAVAQALEDPDSYPLFRRRNTG